MERKSCTQGKGAGNRQSEVSNPHPWDLRVFESPSPRCVKNGSTAGFVTGDFGGPNLSFEGVGRLDKSQG